MSHRRSRPSDGFWSDFGRIAGNEFFWLLLPLLLVAGFVGGFAVAAWMILGVPLKLGLGLAGGVALGLFVLFQLNR